MRTFVRAVVATLGVGVGIVLLVVLLGVGNVLATRQAIQHDIAVQEGVATPTPSPVSPAVMIIQRDEILTSAARPGLETHALLLVMGNAFGARMPINPLYFTMQANTLVYKAGFIDHTLEQYLRSQFANVGPLPLANIEVGQNAAGWLIFEVPAGANVQRVTFDTGFGQRAVVNCGFSCVNK
jgi:hypothetical protein